LVSIVAWSCGDPLSWLIWSERRELKYSIGLALMAVAGLLNMA